MNSGVNQNNCMKKLIPFKLLILLFPMYLNSQVAQILSGAEMLPQMGSFDESFLNSLPANIRSDFLDGQNPDQPSVTTIDPQTRISKLEASLGDAQRTLESIRSEMNAEFLRRPNASMRRFGEQFFSSLQSTFLPISDPNFDGSYVVDVGDELTIQMIGPNRKFFRQFQINRDGTIDLPEIGKVNVAKRTLDDAERIIKSFVDDAYIGAKTTVSLTYLRDMNILMVGNITQPGLYTLQGGTSIIQAIFNAGGINDNGSYRSILHKRNGKTIEQIDLYNVIAFGDFAFSSPLRSGDSIVVQSKGAEVSIYAEALNNAIYELLPGETLGDVLKFAGFNDSRFNTDFPFVLTRAEKNIRKSQKISLNDANSFEPRHADSFQMNSIEPEFITQVKVRIAGEVNVPGSYVLEKGAKLSDLIKLAGGYSDEAYPIGGVFLRESVKNLEMEIRDKAYYDLINYLSASPSFAVSPQPQGLISFLSVLKEFQPSGRVSADFNLQSLKKNPDKDYFLEDNDQIIIPIFKPQIYVFGEVINPGAISYSEGKSIDYYLQKTGGYSRLADNNRVVIIQPNGETFSNTNEFFGLFREKEYLMPGATIYVPKFIGKVDGIDFAATVSPIVSSLALSIASLNSINN